MIAYLYCLLNLNENKLQMNRRESRDDNDLKKRYSLDMFKKKNKLKKEEIIEIVRKKIKEVDIKLKRIDKQVSDNIVDQMAIFESNKRTKKIRKKKESEIKEEKEKDNESKIEINEKDQLLALSTCYGKADDRSLIIAKMLK